MSQNIRGAVIAYNKQTGEEKTKLNLGNCVVLAEAQGKKEELIPLLGKWDGTKQYLDQQDLEIKQFMASLGEKVELSTDDKLKSISSIFNTLTEKDTNKKSQRGAKSLSVGDIHYVYHRLKILEKFTDIATQWQPKRTLHFQTEELQGSIYNAVTSVKIEEKHEDEEN